MKIFFYRTLVVLLIVTGGQLVQAQNSRSMARQQRREQRQEAEAAFAAKLIIALKAKDFNYTANSIAYSLYPTLQNMQLNQYYGITLTPSQIIVNLPLYGSNNFNFEPTLNRRLYFTASQYNYSISQIKGNSYLVNIHVTDPWNMNTYILTLNTTGSGNGVSMSVSTPFTGPVTYSGNITL